MDLTAYRLLKVIYQKKNKSLSLDQQINLMQLQKFYAKSGFSVFLEGDLSRTYQPLFHLRAEDHGLCVASLLMLTFRKGKVQLCPYKQ